LALASTAFACSTYELPDSVSTARVQPNSAGSTHLAGASGAVSVGGASNASGSAAGGTPIIDPTAMSGSAGQSVGEVGGSNVVANGGTSGGGMPAQPACSFTPNDGVEVGFVAGKSPTPSQTWDFALSDSNVVPNTAGVPIYPWFPDGHITVLPDLSGNFLMFWAEVESYRTLGPSVLPETHTARSSEQQLFHGRVETSAYDNGGIWLHSVFRKSGKNLVGFFAAEDQYCCPRDPHQVAWRSMGVASSADNGATWQSPAQILTAAEARPTLAQEHIWGGDGDGSAIWDAEHCRWMIFYQHEYLTAAISTDPEGKPGTWFKYYNGAFTEPGLGGKDSPLAGLDAVHGGNPSVHFNSYLGKWVMVYHGWDPQVSYITSSTDLLIWDKPRFLVDSANPPGRGWYPTIIGETDLRAGQKANLYYTDMDRFDGRHFMHRSITFTRHD
jgi:hypothetical protein